MFEAALANGEIGLVTVWLLGASMGLTACTVTCLPFMGTWVLGRGAGHTEGLRDTGVFLAGRVTAYAALGLFAGLLGSWLTRTLDSGLGQAVIGAASIAAGLWLALPARYEKPCATLRRASHTPPFLLGFSLTLTPCAPLASLLALCAASGGALTGIGYGLAFGLGTALTPMLVIIPLLGWLGGSLRAERPWLTVWLRWGAAAVLVAIGIRRLLMVS